MTDNNSPAKGFAVLSAAGVLNKILSVIYMPVLLRILEGDQGYGIYNAGYQIYVFIYVLTNSGFPIAISKLQAELIAGENYKDAMRSFKMARSLLFLYGLIMTILTAFLARGITNIMGFSSSYLVILALSPTMLFTAISSSYRGYFNGNSDMKPTAISQIIEQFLNVALSLLFALLLKPYGLEWACAGATVGTTLGALGSAVYLNIKYNRKRQIWTRNPDYVERLTSKDIINRLLRYSIPIAINSVIIYGGNLVDIWNTKQRLLAAGLTEAQAIAKYGTLGKYTQLLNVPLAITASLYIAIIPSISAAIAVNDRRLLKSHIGEAYRVCLMLSIPAAAGLGVLSRPIFLMLFSARYSDGWYLMAIGSMVIVLMSIIQVQSGILQSLNKTRLATFSMLCGIALKIFTNYFLIGIKEINITGAVVGTILCYILAVYLNGRHIRKHLPVDVSIKKRLGRPIVASTAMGIITFGVYKLIFLILSFISRGYIANTVSTVIAVGAGILVYGIIMLRIGGITERDLKIIPFKGKLKRFMPSYILSLAKSKG